MLQLPLTLCHDLCAESTLQNQGYQAICSAGATDTPLPAGTTGVLTPQCSAGATAIPLPADRTGVLIPQCLAGAEASPASQ